MTESPEAKPLRPPRVRLTDAEWAETKARLAAERVRPYDGDILIAVEGDRRLYGAGEPIRLQPHQAGAAVAVTGENGLPLAAFRLPEVGEDVGEFELEHPGPPRIRLSLGRSGDCWTAVTQREVGTGALALFDDARWLRCHWIIALVLAAGWMIVGAQVALIDTLKDASTDSNRVYAVTAYLLGVIPGGVLFGWAADRVGRKPVYTATALIYVVTGFVAALLPVDLPPFTLMCFLVGIATGGEYVVLNTALQELMPKHRRGWACLAVNGAFWLGYAAIKPSLLFAHEVGMGAATDRWQSMFWIVGVLGIMLLGLRRFLPESPRWLITNCRKDRRTQEMRDEIRRDLKIGSERPEPTGPRLLVPARVPIQSLAGLMWGKYRRQTLVCLALMCSQAFFYNAFSHWFGYELKAIYGDKEGPISYDHLIYYIAAANFAGPLLLGRWFDETGRRTMIWASYMISGFLLLGIATFLFWGWKPPSPTKMTIAWVLVFFFASAAASSAYLTLGESFPVEIRATAFSLPLAISMLVGVLGSLLYGWLTGGAQHHLIALGVLGALAGAAMIAAAMAEKALGTEYAGLSLEEGVPPLSQVEPATS